MNLSRAQIEQLGKEVNQLEANVARRKRLLAAAYPVLNDAINNTKHIIHFASTDFSMADFQNEIDTVLALQNREQRQLKIKKEGLTRLEKTARGGENVIAEMRQALESTEQEVAVLKSRRDHAHVEAATLSMIASVNSDQQRATNAMMSGVDRLKTQVRELEARNEACRNLAPGCEDERGSELNRTWTRLESLRAFHDELKPTKAIVEKTMPETLKASELVINIRPNAEANDKPADGE